MAAFEHLINFISASKLNDTGPFLPRDTHVHSAVLLS